jgi:iron complex transport system substrate-binding protein
MTTLSRLRPALVLSLVVAVTAAVAGCSASATPVASSSASDSSWSFTDDLGKTVTLDSAPTRIAGANDLIVSMLHYGIKPVASFGYSAIADDARFDGLDTSGIVQVGATAGEIDLEKLAAAKPDVIIAEAYPTDEKGTIDPSQPDYGFKDLAQQKQIEAIAPIITIVQGGDGATVVKRTTALATALGGDSATIAAAKKTYDTAAAALTAATKANPVTVTALYADADGVSVAKNSDDPALHLYADLGVKFFAPTPAGFYWAQYSWENAGKVGGDVYLLEQDGYQAAELKKQPTIASAAAITSGQVHPWLSAALDYVSQAAYMTELAGWISDSKVVTG